MRHFPSLHIQHPAKAHGCKLQWYATCIARGPMLIVFNTPHISLSLSPNPSPLFETPREARAIGNLEGSYLYLCLCLSCMSCAQTLSIDFFSFLRSAFYFQERIFGKYGKLFNFVPRGVCRYCVCEDIYENNWYDNAEPRRCKEGDYVVPSISNFLKHTSWSLEL